jgi:hypothetical protein
MIVKFRMYIRLLSRNGRRDAAQQELLGATPAARRSRGRQRCSWLSIYLEVSFRPASSAMRVYPRCTSMAVKPMPEVKKIGGR